MTTLDTILNELIAAGNKVTGDLAASGRVSMTSHIELKNILKQAESLLANGYNGNQDNGQNKGKVSKPASKGKLYQVKHLVELLKTTRVQLAKIGESECQDWTR
jgi:hypothetical protein